MKHVIRGGLFVALLLLITQGCAPVRYVDDQVTGNLYLNQNRYQEGVRDFQARVGEMPGSHLRNYYLGRYLLALKRPEEALGYLREAVRLSPDTADYHYWLGVAYWALDDPANERLCYQNAISLDKDHLPARVYLGHNLLDSGDAHGALLQYEYVLGKDPYHPEALFNRAKALSLLGRKSQEISAWKQYLTYYPDGSLARDAALNLNKQGNFSYRTQIIGIRRMVLDWIAFEPGTAILDDDAFPSLNAVGSVLESSRDFRLAVNAFVNGDQVLARQRAETVRQYILDHYAVAPDRIEVQAQGRAERIRVADKTFSLNESIVLQTIAWF